MPVPSGADPSNEEYSKIRHLPERLSSRNVVLSFQEDAIGTRLRDVIGPDTMMWGSDYLHSESTFPQSRKILAEILAGVPDDEQPKPPPDPNPGIASGNTPASTNLTWRG